MRKAALGAACIFLCCATARAEDTVDRFERELRLLQRQTQVEIDQQVPLSQRALVDYGGYLTFGYLSFDDPTHDNHGLREYELVGYGRVNLDGANEVYARGRTDYRDYNSGDASIGQGNRLEGRVEEGWYRYDLQRAYASRGTTIQNDVSLTLGRQYVDWGNGLTLDQYVDGGSAEVRAGWFQLDLLACVTVRETIDFDYSRPNFFDDTHRGYFGARATINAGAHHPYAYFLLQRDFNPDEPLKAHVIVTRYRYNSYYAGVGSTGALSDNLSYSGELCFEGGNTLSNSFNADTNRTVSQTGDRIEACAADFQLNYLPNDSHQSRFTLAGIIASGDADRVNSSGTFGGNRRDTVDHAFNSLGVIYAGLAFTPPVSNLAVLRAGVSTYPAPQAPMFRKLQIGTDLFVFAKTRSEAPIDETTTNSHYLGIEPDAFINWQITDDVTLAVRYGVFFPGQAIPSGDPNHVRQFLYAAVTYAF